MQALYLPRGPLGRFRAAYTHGSQQAGGLPAEQEQQIGREEGRDLTGGWGEPLRLPRTRMPAPQSPQGRPGALGWTPWTATARSAG